MTNADSQSSNKFRKLSSVFADMVYLAGLGLVCWGVFKFSIAVGMIVTGLVLIILAMSIAPGKKKS